jgi:hypothetical protein
MLIKLSHPLSYQTDSAPNMKLIVLFQALFIGLAALARADVAPEENEHLAFAKSGSIYKFTTHML